jgi:hypothetical protein
MHQRIAETDWHLAPVVSPPPLGSIDVWTLALGYEGTEIRCRFLRTFLWYLGSPSTHAAAVNEVSSSKSMVDITLFGPIADDGERHYVRFTATRADCWNLITGSERKLLSRELGRLVRIGRQEKLGTWAASTACSILKLPMPPPGV